MLSCSKGCPFHKLMGKDNFMGTTIVTMRRECGKGVEGYENDKWKKSSKKGGEPQCSASTLKQMKKNS